MRSGTSLAALAALSLAIPATAQAATPKSGTFKATKVQLGYDLKFKVKGAKITDIVGHVLENCDGSSMSTVTTVAPEASWKIKKNGSFSGRKKESAHGVTLYTTFKGKFTSKTTAKGIVRVESIVAGSTCDTYELKWTAKRS